MTTPQIKSSSNTVLSLKALGVSFFTDAGELKVVENVSFDIERGQTIALVGESGCGKSVTALAVMGLLDYPGRIVGGSLRFDGTELVGSSASEWQKLRGLRIGMIFQEPMTSLNPVFTIGDQIAEVLKHHFQLDTSQANAEVLRLLQVVGIPAPEKRMVQYPHELSGGMKQRAMIAIAIACKPDLLIADEPTTALDVTIQAQILELLRSLQRDFGMAILLITHNLGVVAHFAEEVMVMYAGHLCEHAPVRDLFKNPRHPYTQALLASLPNPLNRHSMLASISGSVPSPLDFPSGCRFAGRCEHAQTACATQVPPVRQVSPRHKVACWLHE